MQQPADKVTRRVWQWVGAAWGGASNRAAAWVLVLSVVLAAVSGWLAADRLGIDTDTSAMISEDATFRRLHENFKRDFPQFGNVLLIVLDGPPAAPVAEMAEALARQLAARQDTFSAVRLAEADPFFMRNGLLYLDAAALQQLGDRLASAQPLLAALNENPSLGGLFSVLGEAARAAAAEPAPIPIAPVFARVAEVAERTAADQPGRFDWRGLIQGGQPGSNRRLIEARPVLDYASLSPAADAIDAARLAARDLGLAQQGVRMRLTGDAALEETELDSALRGAAAAGVVSLLAVGALLVLGLGSWRLVGAVLATLLIGLVWTAGIANVAVGHLNLISIGFAVLFFGLAVDFGIHLALRYREALEGGASAREALSAAIASGAGPVALTAAAAAIGFFAFAPTDYRGLSELGLIAGAGMVAALIANLTVLPALLRLLPPPALLRRGRRRGGGVEQSVTRHAGWIVAMAAVLAAGAAVLAPSLRFNFDPLDLQDPSTEAVATFRALADDPDTTPFRLSVVAPNLAQAEALAARLRSLDAVARATTLADYVPANQDERRAIIGQVAAFMTPLLIAAPPVVAADDAAQGAAVAALRNDLLALADARPDTEEGASARALHDALAPFVSSLPQERRKLERRLLDGLAPALSQLRAALAPEQVDFAQLPGWLRDSMVTAAGKARVDVVPSSDLSTNQEMREFVAAVRTIAPDAIGAPAIVIDAGEVVLQSFAEAGALSFAAILILLALTLRKRRDALLVFVPVVLAGILTAAAMVLLGVAFNFANVIVLPLLLGLGVAGGIHIVARMRAEGALGDALESSTPRAVLFSALTTIASFGSLMISPHRGTASMGLLLTIALLFTLFATLVVLPALVALAAGRQAK